MSTLMAIIFLAFLFTGPWALLERTHRRSAGLPRMPFGADPERDVDLRRVRHDLAVTRTSR